MNTNGRIDLHTETSPAQRYIAFMIARGKPSDTIQLLWEDYITDLVTGGVKIDVNELVQSVLSQAYLQTNSDLRALATKVTFYNEMHRQIRDEIKRLRSLKQDIDSYVERLEDQSIDDAEIALNLQSVAQDYQQAVQTMSNVINMMHDTAMTVIRKIEG